MLAVGGPLTVVVSVLSDKVQSFLWDTFGAKFFSTLKGSAGTSAILASEQHSRSHLRRVRGSGLDAEAAYGSFGIGRPGTEQELII
jgi:hypothetical protein